MRICCYGLWMYWGYAYYFDLFNKLVVSKEIEETYAVYI